jgi:hypothetical protein
MKEGKSPTDCILKENRMCRKEKKMNKKKGNRKLTRPAL